MFFHVVCVFFFKQKTAYEMRISDWSSDVCSSDLSDRSAIWLGKTLATLAFLVAAQVVALPAFVLFFAPLDATALLRSEERRVGKECVSSVDLGGRRSIKKKNDTND